MRLIPGGVLYFIIVCEQIGNLHSILVPGKTNSTTGDGFRQGRTDRGDTESINALMKRANDINDTARTISHQNYSGASAESISIGAEYDKKHSTQSNSRNNDAKLAERKIDITRNDAAERKQSGLQWTAMNSLLEMSETTEMSERGINPAWSFDADAIDVSESQSHHINKRAISNTNNNNVLPACENPYTRHYNSSTNMTEIMIAVLLPDDDRRPFSIRKIQPAMMMAIEKMNPLLAQYNHTMVINFRDSKCDIADSINEAINFYVHHEVDILFGPCCDYALAPVARQVKYWNLPLITAGGLAAEYGTAKTNVFSQITRVGPNFNRLVDFFREVMRIYKWRHLKLLYNPDGHSDLSSRTCHIAVHDLHYGLLQSYEKFEDDSEVLNNLPDKIDLKNAGGVSSYMLQFVQKQRIRDFVMDIFIRIHIVPPSSEDLRSTRCIHSKRSCKCVESKIKSNT